MTEYYYFFSIHEQHLYKAAEQAVRALESFGRNQSIIISGESGSGKTEATKFILSYLVNRTNDNAPSSTSSSSSGGSTANIHKRIIDANPIMESFGNAKTIRNNNSSRFGKLFQVQYDKAGSIVGATIVKFLLEKSRVVAQNDGERNYHVFYQVLY